MPGYKDWIDTIDIKIDYVVIPFSKPSGSEPRRG